MYKCVRFSRLGESGAPNCAIPASVIRGQELRSSLAMLPACWVTYLWEIAKVNH